MTAAQREFDIVLYGATGFVGKLTAEYLATAGGPARIALAGRSTESCVAVRDSLGERRAVVAAHRGRRLVAVDAERHWPRAPGWSSRTVGPYTKYGLPLVAACAAAGTDYADLTGETMFIRDSIDLYHKQAADNGARIVHSCGFDSIPSDLTVYALYKRARADGTGELGETNFVLRGFAGGVSGRHRRLDDGGHAHRVDGSRGAAGDERPLHADHRPRRRTRVRPPVRHPVAARRATSPPNSTASGPAPS